MGGALDVKRWNVLNRNEASPEAKKALLVSCTLPMHHHYNGNISRRISMADIIIVYQPNDHSRNLIIKARSVHSNSGAKPNLTGFTTLTEKRTKEKRD